MKNKIIERRQALEAARNTLTYKIDTLRQFYSKEQVRCWRVNRYNIIQQLKALPTEEQIQKGAKRINFSNSSKFGLLLILFLCSCCNQAMIARRYKQNYLEHHDRKHYSPGNPKPVRQ